MLMEAEEMGLLRMGDRLLERNGWADFRAVPHIRTFLGQRRGRRSEREVGLDQAPAAVPASLTRPVTRCPSITEVTAITGFSEGDPEVK